MHRSAHQDFPWRQLHDAALAHDRHAIGHIIHHRKIMRDEEVGKPEILLQIFQQIENLRLHGNIESGDGFVADQQFRAKREGSCNADTLSLPARKTVRITVQRAFPKPDGPDEIAHFSERYFASPRPWISSGSLRMFPTVMRGDSDDIGS